VRITTVFNKLLALQGALVRRVSFGTTAITVEVEKRARKLRCPYCPFSGSRHRDSSSKIVATHVSLAIRGLA
jgi:hypothetical protein